jgi:hypothetical protein
LEMTAVQHVGAAAWPHSRSPSPWPPLDGSRASTPAGAAAGGVLPPSEGLQGSAVVALSMLPAGSRPGRLPPLLQPALHTAAGEHPQHHSSTGSWLLSLTSAGHPAAAAASPPSVIIPPSPSPSPSMVSLQSGTVLATPEDFAPAAAAAAAHIASPAAARQRSTSPTVLADAAQASVAALRASSRNLGRRLQVLLSPSAMAPAVNDTTTATTAAGGYAGTGLSSSGGPSSPQQQEPQPGLVLGTLPPAGPAGPRVAVSIYAYAGHPTSADHELDAQQQQQQQSPHAAITVLNLPGSVEQGSGEQQRRR